MFFLDVVVKTAGLCWRCAARNPEVYRTESSIALVNPLILERSIMNKESQITLRRSPGCVSMCLPQSWHLWLGVHNATLSVVGQWLWRGVF